MARRYDADESARLLLAAAEPEFAERGLAGARVDRIAAAAGVNKALIYSYFGSKEALFAAVLRDRLGELAAWAPIDADDVPAYAGRVFDFLVEHPELVRLTADEGAHFAPEAVPGFAERAGYFAGRVQALAANGRAADPAALLLSVVAQSYWFIAAPQMVRMIFGAVPDDEVRRRYRAQVVANAHRMVA